MPKIAKMWCNFMDGRAALWMEAVGMSAVPVTGSPVNCRTPFGSFIGMLIDADALTEGELGRIARMLATASGTSEETVRTALESDGVPVNLTNCLLGPLFWAAHPEVQ